MAIRSRRHNAILSVEGEDGRQTTEEGDITRIFIRHFFKLYMSFFSQSLAQVAEFMGAPFVPLE
jgi:hypothetical protein